MCARASTRGAGLPGVLTADRDAGPAAVRARFSGPRFVRGVDPSRLDVQAPTPPAPAPGRSLGVDAARGGQPSHGRRSERLCQRPQGRSGQAAAASLAAPRSATAASALGGEAGATPLSIRVRRSSGSRRVFPRRAPPTPPRADGSAARESMRAAMRTAPGLRGAPRRGVAPGSSARRAARARLRAAGDRHGDGTRVSGSIMCGQGGCGAQGQWATPGPAVRSAGAGC